MYWLWPEIVLIFCYVIDCDGDVLRGYHSLLLNKGESIPEISEEITILGGQQNTERRFSRRSKELRNEERRFPSMRWQMTQARTRMSHMGDSPSFWKSMGGMARNEGYTKQQLLRLCTTYGVPHTLRDNKHVLAGNLINTVLASDCIPHPRYLDNLSVEACVRPGSVRLRLITRYFLFIP